MLFNFKRITKKRKEVFFLCKYGMTRFYAPWSQCCAHFVFMCAPLISRDGQQQSRGVNSCIRVLIIAVMRLCSRASHSPFSPFLEVAVLRRWSYLSGFLASVAPFKWRYHHRRWRGGPNWQRKQERCLRRPMRKNRKLWRTRLKTSLT